MSFTTIFYWKGPQVYGLYLTKKNQYSYEGEQKEKKLPSKYPTFKQINQNLFVSIIEQLVIMKHPNVNVSCGE